MKITFFGLLTIALIVLKLTHVINWGWGWIFIPIWLPLVIAIILAAVFGGKK